MAKAKRTKKSWHMDRDRVAGDQPHEVAYFKEAFNVEAEHVHAAIAAVGHMREDIMQWLSDNGHIENYSDCGA